MTNTDGNISALNKHLAEQEANEAKYEDFLEVVRDEFADELYEMGRRYEAIAREYSIDTHFLTIIRDELL